MPRQKAGARNSGERTLWMQRIAREAAPPRSNPTAYGGVAGGILGRVVKALVMLAHYDERRETPIISAGLWE